jgi:phenylalanyl-tRNA synthetase beta subunit
VEATAAAHPPISTTKVSGSCFKGWLKYAVASYEDIAVAICRIISTSKTPRYVVTARAVMRVLSREIPPGALRAALNKYGFVYMRASGVDVGKYVVDVETAKSICERIMRRKKRARF